MVVCHCRAVNDALIRDLAARPGCSPAGAIHDCGAGTGCGSCHETLARLERELDEQRERDEQRTVVPTGSPLP